MTRSFRKQLHATKAAFYLLCNKAKSNKRWNFQSSQPQYGSEATEETKPDSSLISLV